MRIFVFKKETLIRVAAFAIIIAGAVVYTRAVTQDDKPAFSDADTQMVSSYSTQEKEVALTIDTTFGNDRTEEILSVLKKHGATATFAVMGAWAKENPDKVRSIKDAGHEIISHSMTHDHYNDLGEDKSVEDAKAAKEYLKTEFGIDTSKIRPPYGTANSNVLEALSENGFETVKWSIDSKDWRGDTADSIAKRVLENIKPGSIVLFQNNNDSTPDALNMVLEKLAEASYRTVSMSEMSVTDGKNI